MRKTAYEVEDGVVITYVRSSDLGWLVDRSICGSDGLSVGQWFGCSLGRLVGRSICGSVRLWVGQGVGGDVGGLVVRDINAPDRKFFEYRTGVNLGCCCIRKNTIYGNSIVHAGTLIPSYMIAVISPDLV